jgi:hypothetical protein
MNRIRRINTRRLKKIASLTATSLAIILLIILLEPVYTFIAKVVYAFICLHVIVRVWSQGLRDWDILTVA